MPKNDAWSVSTVSMLSALNRIPMVDDIPLHDLKYRVLDDKKVVYRNAQELAEIHSIAPHRPPKEFVSFRPERLALHETIVSLYTTVKLEDEKATQNAVATIHARVLKNLNSLHLEPLRNEIEASNKKLIKQYLKGQDIGSETDGAKIKQICDQIKALPEDIFGKYKEGFTAMDAMEARATDALFTEQAMTKIKELVQSTLQEQIDSQQLEAFDIPASNERLTLMVSGGQASGKGSSVAQLKYLATQEDIAWNNTAKINTDSYKSLLLEAADVKPILYSQLAQEEASLISQKINNRINQLALENKAPHAFIDQVFLGADQINTGLVGDGKVRGIIVSTEVGDAVERSFGRGQKEGRYENTQVILNCHKNMAIQVPTTLAKYAGQDVAFKIVDNNVPPGTQPTDVAEIDVKNKTIVIHSEPHLERFSKKSQINTAAKENSQLYLSDKGPSAASYLQPLKDKSFTIKTIDEEPQIENKPDSPSY